MQTNSHTNQNIDLKSFQEEKRLSFWLLVSLILIFGMVVVGGLTRLTGSGLSMVTWKPLTGFVPPLTLPDWQILFQEYQSSPEFLKVNFDMSLDDFKNIFWLEFIHRVWGRIIGIVFLIPLFLCFKSPALRRKYGLSIFAIWCLGGMQGAMGWYMVKSGLVNDPAVSHYRLAAHLLLAFLTFGLILWMYLTLKAKHLTFSSQRSISPSWVVLVLGLSILTVFYGALVAGLKAGLLYNTFPTMDGAWLPDAFFDETLSWTSFFEEPGLVQWIHRCLAITTFSLIVFVWTKGRRSSCHFLNLALHTTLVCGLMQVCLGIITLLLQVPVSWGVLHQAGALITLTSLIITLFFSDRSFKRHNAGQGLSFQSFQKGASGKRQTT